jgi:Ca2+-binding EF-hand superfamily protein
VHNSRIILLILSKQVIFFWTLLVRHIARFFHANPTLRAQHLPAALALHDILKVARDSTQIDLLPQDTQQIKELFDLFDTNGGGSIDQEELDAAMFALGFQRNDESRSMPRVEPPSNSVTLDDFITIMKGENSGSCQNEDLWLCFSILIQSGRRGFLWGSALPLPIFELDSNVMPEIKLDALKLVCHEFEVRLTDDELVYMMDEADYDNSGSVDIHKFMRILERTPWF